MTLFAVARRWGRPARSAGEGRTAARASRADSATSPRPPPARARKSRRECGISWGGKSLAASSIRVERRVAVHDGVAEADRGAEPGVLYLAVGRAEALGLAAEEV